MAIRTRAAEWFLTKIRYEKTDENGMTKKVSEQYVVDALSFTEGENSITEEMSDYISGEFDVDDMKKCPFKEIMFSDKENAGRWYKAKLQFITIDEKTEKEKRTSVCYLVNAGSFADALKNVTDVMGETMIDYVVSAISETAILDVFEHKTKE